MNTIYLKETIRHHIAGQALQTVLLYLVDIIEELESKVNSEGEV